MNNSVYTISSIALSNNRILDFSQRLKNLNMIFNYEEYMFPIVYIDALLSVEEFKEITNDSDMKIKLSLKRVVTNPIDDKLTETYEYCFKDKVFCIMNDNNYYLTNPSSEEISQFSDITNLMKIRFILITEEDLLANKVNLSGSFGDCNLQSLLIYLMDKIDSPKKTIIANPNNNMMLDQILIPYGTALNTFKYIDTVYGIYENGLKIFFDLNKNYILNKNGNEFEDNSIKKNIIIDIPSAANVGTKDLKKDTITVFGRDISFANIDTVRAEYMGTDNSFIMNNEARSIMRKNWKQDEGISTLEFQPEKRKVYYQKYSNPFIKNQVNPGNNMVISANTANANYNLINFINEFSIKEDKVRNFEGLTLNLTNYTHKFVRTRDNMFEMHSIMNFKKI